MIMTLEENSAESFFCHIVRSIRQHELFGRDNSIVHLRTFFMYLIVLHNKLYKLERFFSQEVIIKEPKDTLFYFNSGKGNIPLSTYYKAVQFGLISNVTQVGNPTRFQKTRAKCNTMIVGVAKIMVAKERVLCKIEIST